MLAIDGNEAAARIAHLTNEVIAIYPITPASPMGVLAGFSAGDKPVMKQYRALMAMSYGNIHVVQAALSGRRNGRTSS